MFVVIKGGGMVVLVFFFGIMCLYVYYLNKRDFVLLVNVLGLFF